tara:strand:+ start:783 stop:2117 length:1335 start_codon:yes stop_codon:yes gene_type:complete
MKIKNIILLLLAFVYSNSSSADSLLKLINSRDYLKVIELTDEVIKRSIDQEHDFFKKASEAALLLDDFDKSIQYLKKAISINDNKAYRDEWDRIVRMRKDIEIALKSYQEENNVDEAIASLESLKDSYSSCALIDYSIGKIYQQEEDYESALKWFKEAVRINPYREKYKLSLNYIIGRFITDGDEYYSMRDFSTAIEQYLFAYNNLSFSNNDSEEVKKIVALKFKLSKTYYFLKEYSKSRKMLESLVALDTTHYEAYKLLGDVLKKDGNIDSALSNYLLSIEINENYEKAYLAIGQIYLYDNKPDKALEYLERAIEIKKDYAKAYETIGVIYQNSADGGNSRDYTKAIYYYEQAISYDRRNYKVMSRLSSVYNNLENYDLGKKYAKDCIKIKRNYPDAYYELGIAEKGLGNRIAAINSFESAKKSSKWRKIAQYEIDLIKKELD